MGENTVAFRAVCAGEGVVSLDDVVRLGAQQMLRHALEVEVEAFTERYAGRRQEDGRAVVVRNGYQAQRSVLMSGGSIEVWVPRTRSREDDVPSFVSRLVPPYRRRSLRMDEAIPMLYLAGVSTGKMMDSLKALFGDQLKDMSASTVSRLKAVWIQQHQQWCKRDLSKEHYCYLWCDGIHFNTRFGDDRLCVLVVIGARKDGSKELVAVSSGYRESEANWSELLRDLRERGLECPELFIGDGALGLWKAASQVYPQARGQRCWVHKAANVLAKLPTSVQGRAKGMLSEIYRAPTREKAKASWRAFRMSYESKYPEAVACLDKDETALLTFYSFPAKHWQHIRSTNVIESAFATVRLRSEATRGHGTEATTLAMAFKLLQEAQKGWRKLRGYRLISNVINGVQFVNGEQTMPMVRKAA
jgi:transposase-like protein